MRKIFRGKRGITKAVVGTLLLGGLLSNSNGQNAGTSNTINENVIQENENQIVVMQEEQQISEEITETAETMENNEEQSTENEVVSENTDTYNNYETEYSQSTAIESSNTDEDYATEESTHTSTETSTTSSTIVYVTDTGDKYHRAGCAYLKKSQRAIDQDEAESRGYTPCSKCF